MDSGSFCVTVRNRDFEIHKVCLQSLLLHFRKNLSLPSLWLLPGVHGERIFLCNCAQYIIFDWKSLLGVLY